MPQIHAFAGRRAHTPRELGEVVGRHQALEGIEPCALSHQLVPLLGDGDGGWISDDTSLTNYPLVMTNIAMV